MAESYDIEWLCRDIARAVNGSHIAIIGNVEQFEALVATFKRLEADLLIARAEVRKLREENTQLRTLIKYPKSKWSGTEDQ